MKIDFGMIGRKEIDLAKEELADTYQLNDGSWMKKNLWYEKPHTGNYVKGYAYDEAEELLEEEVDACLYAFSSEADIEEYITEFEYSFSESDLKDIKTIISKGNTAYMIDEKIGEDKDSLIFDRISDGQYIWEGTVEEAHRQLDQWNGWDTDYDSSLTELLVMGVLK